MPRRLSQLLAVALPLLLLLALFSVYYATVWSAQHGRLGFLPYAYSELLINYAAGFIRRGLLGQLIRTWAHGGSALIATGTLLFVNYCVFLCCFVALAYRKLRRSWAVLLVCLMPSSMIYRAMTGEFWSRKESFFFSLLACSALAKVAIESVQSVELRKRLLEALVVVLWIQSFVCCLIHDGFTFMAAPAYAYMIQSAWRLRQPTRESNAKRLSRYYLAVQLGLFLLLGVVFHTSTRVADGVWASLDASDKAFFPGADKGGITILTLGMRAVLGNLPRLLNQGILWWYVGPLLLLCSYCAALIAITASSPTAERGWLRCYLTLFLMISPMFVMGYDYGRWIAAFHMAFLIVWFATTPEELRSLALLPDSFFTRIKSGLEGALEQLRGLATGASLFLRRHVAAVVLVMLCFDCFSYLPEVAPGARWTSLPKQFEVLIHEGREVLHDRR